VIDNIFSMRRLSVAAIEELVGSEAAKFVLPVEALLQGLRIVYVR
jgi:hypothetical protein